MLVNKDYNNTDELKFRSNPKTLLIRDVYIKHSTNSTATQSVKLGNELLYIVLLQFSYFLFRSDSLNKFIINKKRINIPTLELR